uniref:Putative secreted protein n=1 Tax=Anopheles darlingi TaxID=43151 RepID=A0A2M4D8D5_ANODA
MLFSSSQFFLAISIFAAHYAHSFFSLRKFGRKILDHGSRVLRGKVVLILPATLRARKWLVWELLSRQPLIFCHRAAATT